MNCLKRTIESAANNVQTLYAYFQKMSKSCLPNPQGPLSKQLPSSCIESANNHVEEMAKQTTAEGAKGRKRGPYKSCLVSFSSYYLHCTSPTPSHVQLWAERQCELSARVLRRGGNHEKMWRSRNFYHENFQLWDFQQFHENFEPRKFGAIRYYFVTQVCVVFIRK